MIQTLREKARARAKLWYQANKSSLDFIEKSKERLRIWRNKHPNKYLFQLSKQRAKEYNWEHNIDLEDIVIPELCPALGVRFEFNTPYAMSIDRIDSNKGYVKGNVQVISRKANLMKQNATIEELKNFARWVIQTYPD